MSNAIPMQIYIDKNNNLFTSIDKDVKKNKRELDDAVRNSLGNSYTAFDYRKNQKIVTGEYICKDASKVYFMLANVTFMGGRDGQHPLDLKRIQYNVAWRNFYNEYSKKGKVLWLGLYSYCDTKIWAFFEPESYLAKHEGKTMLTKSGIESSYSCHIYLNDLYQGYENGIFKKEDKNGNIVGAVKYDKLALFFEGEESEKNPIVEAVNAINNECFAWKHWIRADKAITFMKNVKDRTGYKQWKQNLWNGWIVEAIYSDYLHDNPSKYLDYVATTQDKSVIKEYKDSGLDLAFPHTDYHFIGDLKAVCIGDGLTLLNDASKVNAALKKYKKIWFLMYIHEKKQGKTNDFEMVKWRNNYIHSLGEWPKDKEYNELSAPNTPHSIAFSEMVIIELNDITKNKYFCIGEQYGNNSNGDERNEKYKVDKRLLDSINDDSFVIYRYKAASKQKPLNKNYHLFSED